MRGAAIMVKRVDEYPPVKGIYDDLFKNEMWLGSFAVYLNSEMKKFQEIITPGKMLAYTTAAIVVDRYFKNNPLVESADSATDTQVDQSQQQQSQNPQQTQNKQPNQTSEMQSLHKSISMGFQNVAFQTEM